MLDLKKPPIIRDGPTLRQAVALATVDFSILIGI
jgi:hypothetical protein